MSAAYGRDFLSVGRSGEPVMNRGPNSAPLDRRLAGPGMAGNQQQHSFSVNQGALQRPIDGTPGGVEIVTMQVDDAVRFD